MPVDLSSLLRDVVKKAATAPTAGGTESDIARMRKRFDHCGNKIVVLADCSGSMSSSIGSLGVTKMEHLMIALKDLLSAHPEVTIIAFNSYVKTLNSIHEMLAPSGSTNLTEALEVAAKLTPRRTIIISDGLADDTKSASEMVDQVTGRIDCVYCGPDGHPAVAFLQSLARRGAGHQMTFDGCKELSPMIRGLLA